MVLGYDLDLSSIDLPEYGATTNLSISDEVRSACWDCREDSALHPAA